MNIRQVPLGDLDTNCYIVWDAAGNALVIDPADSAEYILSVLRQGDLTLQAVVLTHAHFDHMLAAGSLCQTSGAPLYVGAADEPALSDPRRNLSSLFTNGTPVTLTADRLLREGDVLTVGQLSFTVLETPGHTPGCICLLGKGVLFSGDTLFCGSIGRTDFPGGDVPAMMASLHRLTELPEDTVVYSGHGPATTVGREKQTNPYLR